MKVNEQNIQDYIHEALDHLADLLMEEGDDSLSKMSIKTYEDVGMLTPNKGLVIRVNDKEFRVTINS